MSWQYNNDTQAPAQLLVFAGLLGVFLRTLLPPKRIQKQYQKLHYIKDLRETIVDRSCVLWTIFRKSYNPIEAEALDIDAGQII